jgi:subtilisin family serine protease
MRRLLTLILLAMLGWLPSVGQRAAWQKLSPMLRQMVREQAKDTPSARSLSSRYPSPSLLSDKKRTPEVCALMRITDEPQRVLADYGCRDLGSVGNIHVVSIPVGSLGALSLDPHVARIEARPVGQTLLDTTSIVIGTASVHDGLRLPQAFTGRGVTVGLMDIGFDLTHPTFLPSPSAGNQPRVKRLWDMLSTDTVGSTLYVGRDYTTPEELLAIGHTYDGLEQTHGTHTAGIAVGNGYDSPYRGMAPESDICLVANAVSNNANLIDSTLLDRYTFTTDVLGFKYLFDSARESGQPCVVSFSEGSAQDFWGYDCLYYEMLDSLLGPGRIMVSAAGNQGNVKSWFRTEAQTEPTGMFVSHTESPMLLTLKSGAVFLLRLVHYADDGNDTLFVRTADVLATDDSLLVVHTSPTDSVVVEAYPNCYDAGETCYDVMFGSTTGKIGKERPLSVEIVDNMAAVECWRYNGLWDTNALNPRLDAGEYTHNVLSPSSAPRVICVGATLHRKGIINHSGQWLSIWEGEPGQIAPFSSVGPTMDGRTKPDVVAPGNVIVSAINSFFMENHDQDNFNMTWTVADFNYNGRTYGWQANMGTSMSCPVVAGIIALWLQAKPDLTPEDVMGVISRTSRQPDPALSYPNNEYGYGEIDAYRGLLDILGIDKIDAVSSSHTSARITLRGRDLVVTLPEGVRADGPLTLTVYALDGRQLYRTTAHLSPSGEAGGELSFLLPHSSFFDTTKKGIYAVQLDGPPAVSGSTLIRY